MTATFKKDIAALTNALSLNEEIGKLTNERKELVSAKLKDKHEFTGSILLGTYVTACHRMSPHNFFFISEI